MKFHSNSQYAENTKNSQNTKNDKKAQPYVFFSELKNTYWKNMEQKKEEILVCGKPFERGGETYSCQDSLLPENEFCSVCFPSNHKKRNRQLDVEKKKKIAEEKKKEETKTRQLEVEKKKKIAEEKKKQEALKKRQELTENSNKGFTFQQNHHQMFSFS